MAASVVERYSRHPKIRRFDHGYPFALSRVRHHRLDRQSSSRQAGRRASFYQYSLLQFWSFPIHHFQLLYAPSAGFVFCHPVWPYRSFAVARPNGFRLSKRNSQRAGILLDFSPTGLRRMAKGSRLRTSVLAEGTSFTRKTAGSTSYDLAQWDQSPIEFPRNRV